ncbi:MAG: ABC transporter substrate-binding protein [Chloroflexota bacterium]
MKRPFCGMLARMLLVAMVVLLVAAACAPAAKPTTGAEVKKVKVGLSMSLTGALATALEPVSWGAYHYLQYVNEQLGGIEYRTKAGTMEKVLLDIVWEDNAYSVPKTISIYKRQKEAGVKFMAVLGSTPGEAITETASRDKMPVIGFYASTSPANFTPVPLYYTSSFGNMPEQAAVVVKWFKDNWKEARPPKVGVLMLDVPSLRPTGDPAGLPAYAQKIGVEYLGIDFLSAAATDTSIELGRLKTKAPDMILTYHVTGGLVVILKDARRIGFELGALGSGKTVFAAPTWGFDESLLRLVPQEAEGLYGFTTTALSDEDVPGVKVAREICRKYRGAELNLLYLQGVFYGMEVVAGLKQALETVGYESLDGPAINDAIHNLKDFDSGGIAPKINVDPSYPMLNPYARIARVEGGKIKAVSDWYQYPPIREIMPPQFRK